MTEKLMNLLTMNEKIMEFDDANSFHWLLPIFNWIKLILDRSNVFFENGILISFFKILFFDLESISSELTKFWPQMEQYHNSAEKKREEHPGWLILANIVITEFNNIQNLLNQAKNKQIRKYTTWINDSLLDIFSDEFPSQKVLFVYVFTLHPTLGTLLSLIVNENGLSNQRF